jgi:sigma-B regulation protein RsbU (phosphoserine phosphatase)
MSNTDPERIDSELRVARKIQFSLLPPSFPAPSEWREYDLYAQLRPAREIGGDYYDFFFLDADRLVFAVGDVSGKGMPAALYMAVCRTAFRALAGQAGNPGDLLSSVNDMLARDSLSGLYVTLACFFIDMPSGKCEYGIAGHPAPILRRAGAGGGELLDHPREMFVGMKAGVAYPVGEAKLAPGDTLLLYTDGVTEALSGSGEELEHKGLYAMFDRAAAAPTCREIVVRLDRGIGAFMDAGEQQDDMTLLALRYWGPGGARMAQIRNE